MLKRWMLGAVLLSTSLFSQAGLWVDAVTADEMAGIQITATFDNGVVDVQTWADLSSLSSPNSGGVVTNDWSLTLGGDTFGDYDDHNDTNPATGTFYGLWTLSNTSNDSITGLKVDLLGSLFAFDIIEGINPSPTPVVSSPVPGDHTPNSGPGRPFVDSQDAFDTTNVNATFTNQISDPDLYATMDINFNNGYKLTAGEQLLFLTDTDKVPEPSTMFTFALGLIALISLRKKSSGK